MIEIKNVYKTYSSKNGVTHRALENVSLKFASKGLVFILGKSGSGKSTLLNLIGGLDNYDRGDIYFNNENFLNFKDEDFNNYRNSQIGFIFQDFNLINTLSVYDNVRLSLDLQNKNDSKEIDEILKKMNVYDLKNRFPIELSGGQKQRVAIARALIKNPKIILADEPTGSLDSENSISIINIIKELSKDRLVIVVTHNKELAYDYGDRIIEIKDGFVLKDLERKKQDNSDDESSILACSSLVIVPKGQKISNDNLNDLNVTISEKRQDHYLLIETNKNRVVSLYPNIKEIISDSDKQEKFKPYVHVNESQKYEKKGKYKLPLKRGIKIGLSNIKKKIGSLIFTILLSIMSVILIGTASNFTNYNLSSAIAMSIKKDNGQYIEVSSSFASSDSTYKLQDIDISYLNSLKNDISYSYDISLPYTYPTLKNPNSLKNDYLFKNCLFKGLLVCDDITTLGYKSNNFKIIHEMENITESDYANGFYLSSVVANTIVKHDESESNFYEDISDLVGINMRIDNNSYKVLGIYDANGLYKKFEKLSESRYAESEYEDLANEYTSIANSILLKLVVKKEFLNNYTSNISTFDFKSYSTDINGSDVVKGKKILKLSDMDPNADGFEIEYYNSSWNNLNFKEKAKNMNSNQVFIGAKIFQAITGKSYTYAPSSSLFGTAPDDIKQFNITNHNIIISEGDSFNSSNSKIFAALNDVEILGVISRNPLDNNSNGVYLANDIFNEISTKYYMPNHALISVKRTDNHSKIIQNLYDNGLTLNNNFIDTYSVFASIFDTYGVIVNIVALVWFIIVALLIYSFMSNSIKKSSKQIGILKALGANISDLYKVYSSEAILIGLISIVVGISIYYIFGLLVNRIISTIFFEFYFAIFTFEPITILTMIVSTIIIILISLIIPLSRLKNIKPIEVINANE